MFLDCQIKASSESVLKKVLHQVGLPDTMQQQNSLNLSRILQELVYLFDLLYQPTAATKLLKKSLNAGPCALSNASPVYARAEHVTGKVNVWADLITRWGSA